MKLTPHSLYFSLNNQYISIFLQYWTFSRLKQHNYQKQNHQFHKLLNIDPNVYRNTCIQYINTQSGLLNQKNELYEQKKFNLPNKINIKRFSIAWLAWTYLRRWPYKKNHKFHDMLKQNIHRIMFSYIYVCSHWNT